MRRFLMILGGIALLLVLVYLAGPKPAAPVLQATPAPVPQDLAALESHIAAREAAIPEIKPGNAARIVWADSMPARTRYVLLYVHGFSASATEGSDLAEAFAQRYHCNLYLPRLQAHGLSRPEPMLEFHADSLYQSAVDALAVARQLGDSVILMATSTGGTLSLPMAARFPEVAALILYSPNIRIFDPTAAILNDPWGLELARTIKGSNYNEWPADTYRQQYWTPKYRLEAIQQLQNLVEHTMTPETFGQVQQPLFLGYYYKDDVHQDSTVSVAAMLDMYAQVRTPDTRKRKVAFPDAGAHVIGNPVTSHSYEAVRDETFRFAEEVLGLKP